MRNYSGPASQLIFMAVMATVSLPSLSHAEGPAYSVGLGFELASGKYGTGINTDSVYMPFTVAAYPTDRLDFSLEIPLIYQSSSAVVAGQAMGVQSQSTGSRSVMAMVNGSGMGSGSMTSASAGNVGASQYGLGDLKLKAGYVLYTEEEYVPAIRPNLFVKIPTADKNKFLGTGEFDEGFAVELTKWFGAWFADGEVGYTIQGKSTILPVKDYLNYYAGGGYQLTERLRSMLFIKGSSPTVAGAASPIEVRFKGKYQMMKNTGMDGYLSKGISTASPDYGVGLAIYYEF